MYRNIHMYICRGVWVCLIATIYRRAELCDAGSMVMVKSGGSAANNHLSIGSNTLFGYHKRNHACPFSARNQQQQLTTTNNGNSKRLGPTGRLWAGSQSIADTAEIDRGWHPTNDTRSGYLFQINLHLEMEEHMSLSVGWSVTIMSHNYQRNQPRRKLTQGINLCVYLKMRQRYRPTPDSSASSTSEVEYYQRRPHQQPV